MEEIPNQPPGKMTEEYRNDLRRQVYSANIRGMRPSEIANVFKKSESTIDQLLKEARQQRVEQYRQDEKNNEDGAITFLLDEIQAIRNSMFTTLNKLNKAGSKSNNIAGIYNGLIHLIDLEAKMKGVMTTRVTGADGKGPIEIMPVSSRDQMIAEMKKIVEQEEKLNQSLYVLEEIKDDNDDE